MSTDVGGVDAADRAGITKAVAAGVVVVAIGGNEQTSREAWAKTHLGGRPLALQPVLAKADAVLPCWYVG